jgi:hypothetical protein
VAPGEDNSVARDALIMLTGTFYRCIVPVMEGTCVTSSVPTVKFSLLNINDKDYNVFSSFRFHSSSADSSERVSYALQ